MLAETCFCELFFIYIFNQLLLWEQNGNVTIVDTPGIGDSIDNRTMLEEYIPKAVAFVIVMDVSRAGGLQKDRVKKLYNQYKSSMLYFSGIAFLFKSSFTIIASQIIPYTQFDLHNWNKLLGVDPKYI